MPLMIQDMANRINNIRQPVEIPGKKQNAQSAVRLRSRQTTVVMAFVFVLLSMERFPFTK